MSEAQSQNESLHHDADAHLSGGNSDRNSPNYFHLSRRSFVGGAGVGGMTILFHELAQAIKPPTALNTAALPHPEHVAAHLRQPTPGWSGPAGQARYRIEGLAKVMGQKIYARDFRAKDMPGWPAQERLAMILRATVADQLLMGLNLSILPTDALPKRVIVQRAMSVQPANLNVVAVDELNLKLPFSSQGPNCTAPGADCKEPPPCTPSELLVRMGETPLFYGQPIAILIFEDWPTFRRAKRFLQFNPQVVQYGSRVPLPVTQPVPYNPVNYLTRYDVPGKLPFSQVQIMAHTNPNLPNSCQPQNSLAKKYRADIDAALANSQYKSFSGTYSTQVLDPMFMEPEAGLAWVQDGASEATIHLVLGTQATNGDMGDVVGLFKDVQIPGHKPINKVSLYSCYPGGGFGGRDVSTFPPLLGLAAAFSDAPVRIVQDRYEQFQGGLKQLASNITHSLAVDSQGQFVAFRSQQQLPSGGNNNYSQFVAMLTAYCGLSGYNIKQAYVDAAALPTRGVVAGSMRGFGGPQASFAVETLVDEAAVALGQDPIALREKNVLKLGDRTITGAPIEQALPLAEICRRAKAHTLWTSRAMVKAAKAAQGIDYGVGFALANQAFGTGTDGVMAALTISPSGELVGYTNCVDMGNGSATTLAISTARYAGNNVNRIQMGDAALFNALKMKQDSSGSWSDADWTASFSMSSSACLTAFHQVHVMEQATRVLWEAALLPAAAALWTVPIPFLKGKTVWQNGQLKAVGLPFATLSLAQLAQRIYASQLPSGAMVHGLYQGQWVSASYPLPSGLTSLPIDGLSVQNSANGNWQVITRQNIVAPPKQAAFYGRSLYAPSGALVAVEIPRSTGQPKVVALELIVDAGKVLQRDLLIGQAEGGIAMGIGYALLENLPLLEGGAGDGRWNLDRYHVALASDMPTQLNITTLPSTESTAKGIAEAVLCPIAPAIGNAIAYATGKRFRSLPITAKDIKGA
jgi:CO/xanthine dehydrogenase Mo-binding subunit